MMRTPDDDGLDTRLREIDDHVSDPAIDAADLTARVATRRRRRRAQRRVGGTLLIFALLVAGWIVTSPPRPAPPDLAEHAPAPAPETPIAASVADVTTSSEALQSWASNMAAAHRQVTALAASQDALNETVAQSRARRDASRDLSLETTINFIY